MIFKILSCVICLLICGAISAAAPPTGAQSTAAPAKPEAPPAAAPAPPTTSPSVRDPTQANPALRQALSGTPTVPVPVPPQPPLLQRRGLIIVEGQPPEALIEVQGSGMYFVRQGSVFTVAVNGVNMLIRITHLAADNMEFTADAQNAPPAQPLK